MPVWKMRHRIRELLWSEAFLRQPPRRDMVFYKWERAEEESASARCLGFGRKLKSAARLLTSTIYYVYSVNMVFSSNGLGKATFKSYKHALQWNFSSLLWRNSSCPYPLLKLSPHSGSLPLRRSWSVWVPALRD
jgi:hypothetical protein